MRAILCRELAPADKLAIGEVPAPKAGPGQVIVKTHACGIQFVDNRIVEGTSLLNTTKLDDHFGRPFQLTVPFVPGSEASGVVKAVGDGVTAVKVGDRVLGTCVVGAYAEEVCFEEKEVCRIPDEMDFETAACFYVAYYTAYYSLITRGGLRAKETLLVLGAGSGVGLASVQIAKAVGAFVIAAASTDEKLALAKEHGADVAVKYGRGSLSTAEQKALSASFKKPTGTRGIDVVSDLVGGDYAQPAMRALAFKGRYLSIGFSAGIPSIPMHVIFNKNGAILGIEPVTDARLPGDNPEMMRTLFQWYHEKKIHPLITERYPLARAGDALRRLADRRGAGRIVLNV